MSTRLTPTEHQLVSLAAQGYSNQEIAFVRRSRRHTVANQLTSAYRKLGVSSRRELCARIRGPVSQLATERSLTRREHHVLGLVEAGHSNKLIAFSLGIAISTVSTTITRGRRKLGSLVSPPARRLTCAGGGWSGPFDWSRAHDTPRVCGP